VDQSAISAVQLNINGVPWKPTPDKPPTYAEWDPYQLRAASYTYLDSTGMPQSLCGSSQNSTTGQPRPVFTRTGGAQIAPCDATSSAAPAPTSATTQPGSSGNAGHPAKIAKKPVYSMAAVSPDGKELAVVSAGRTGTVSIAAVGAHTALRAVATPLPDVSSISWDRQDDLWLTQDGNVWMVPSGGVNPEPVTSVTGVSALSVAPDGVRVALLIQGEGLQLAAINPSGTQNGQLVPRASQVGRPTISTPPMPLGPGITDPVALAWFDADHLVVVDRTGATSQLEEVPVNGRAGTQLVAGPQLPTGVALNAVAAANTANVLVVASSRGQLWFSAGIEGPWEPAAMGSAPNYRIPTLSAGLNP
jgi:hypothetical protein